ncbi:hypothetical protein B9Q04_14545, partial [Candidatus Marsarchaeota G2 archaeon BE_D]
MKEMSQTLTTLGDRTLGVVSSSRRFMRIGLGALWVIDGALQLQPAMFTPSFPVNVVGPALQSLPNPIYGYSLSILQTYIIPHISAWNIPFAFLQLLIGVLILSNRHTLRALGLALSLVWSGFLWVFGEGLGGIYASTMGGASSQARPAYSTASQAPHSSTLGYPSYSY